MKKNLLFFLLCCVSGLAFSQQNNEWTNQANFSGSASEKGIAFSLKDYGYVGLGKDNAGFKKEIWKYSFEKNSWVKAEDFPAKPRIFPAAFAIGGKGYVGTGLVGVETSREGTNDFWEYDAEKDSWTQKANFPGGLRYGAIGFSINGNGYIGLGANKTTYYNDLWEYNPSLNQWNKKTDFPENGRSDASAFVIGQNAYILFGQGKELLPTKKKSWKFSPVKNEWTEIAEFPGLPRTGVITFSFKNKGYAIGGTNSGVKRYDDFWEYNAARNTWTERDPVPFGSCAYEFSLMQGSVVYVCSGKSRLKGEGPEVWSLDLGVKKTPDKNLIIGGSLLLGAERIPQAAVEVKVLNGKGEVVQSAFTNLFGSFLITNLPEKEDLILTFDVKDPTWQNEKFYITNRKEENVAILNKDNAFKFYLSSAGINKIQLIKIESKNLRMNMKGRLVIDDKGRSPLANTGVSLMNEDGEVVQADITNEQGTFVFDYLPADSTVYLSIDEKIEKKLARGEKILLLDEGDNLVSKTSSANHEFELVTLPPERNSLTKFYMEDAWIPFLSTTSQNLEMKVVEPIYFEVGKWDILPDAKGILNKAVIVLKKDPKNMIEINAHTDSRGDAKSNLELSEKRANAAKEYIVGKGVNAEQVATKGYGETQLINRCKDGVNCTEEEHAVNRRMEFIIRKK